MKILVKKVWLLKCISKRLFIVTTNLDGFSNDSSKLPNFPSAKHTCYTVAIYFIIVCLVRCYIVVKLRGNDSSLFTHCCTDIAFLQG